MKKIIYLLVICFTVSFFSLSASAATNEKTTSKTTETVNSIEVKGLMNNVKNLNSADKSTLAVNAMTTTPPAASARHHRRDGGVLYISGGTILLIVILVILL